METTKNKVLGKQFFFATLEHSNCVMPIKEIAVAGGNFEVYSFDICTQLLKTRQYLHKLHIKYIQKTHVTTQYTCSKIID